MRAYLLPAEPARWRLLAKQLDHRILSADAHVWCNSCLEQYSWLKYKNSKSTNTLGIRGQGQKIFQLEMVIGG